MTREEIIKISEEKSTIPDLKMKMDNSEYRTPSTKANIDSYLKSSNFDKLNPKIFKKNAIDFIKSNSYNYIENFKLDGYECDIFIEELSVGFKMVGLFEFSEINVTKNYLLETHNIFHKNGYKIIQIFEDTWVTKEEIIKSRILNILGKSNRIFARKCEIKEIKDPSISANFIINTHSQGKIGAAVKLGLYYNGELTSIMTFGSLRKNLGQVSNSGDYELLRFVNKLNTNVIGGASKLFKHFIKTYNPSTIISYADKCWSNSDDCLYKTLGMDYVHESSPSYFYIIDTNRKGRFGYRKDLLLTCGYDGSKWGEHTICLSNNIYRIYDCGTCKFKWTKTLS